MTTAGERSDDQPAGPTMEDLRLRVDVHQLGINRLTAEATKLAEQLTEVRDGLQDQIGDLVGRASRDGDPADGSGRAEAARPWNWRDLDEPGRLVLMREVGGWVDWLLQRYPLTATIPPCWAKHPEMVEELIAAHRAWTAAYRSPNATAYAAAEWHDRWLPGLEQRLVHRWKSRRCDDGHQPSTITPVGACLSTRPRIEEEH